MQKISILSKLNLRNKNKAFISKSRIQNSFEKNSHAIFNLLIFFCILYRFDTNFASSKQFCTDSVKLIIALPARDLDQHKLRDVFKNSKKIDTSSKEGVGLTRVSKFVKYYFGQ